MKVNGPGRSKFGQGGNPSNGRSTRGYILTYKSYQSLNIFWPTKTINHSVYSDLQKLSITQYILTYKSYQSLSQAYLSWQWTEHARLYIRTFKSYQSLTQSSVSLLAMGEACEASYKRYQTITQYTLTYKIYQSLSKFWPIKAINQSSVNYDL